MHASYYEMQCMQLLITIKKNLKDTERSKSLKRYEKSFQMKIKLQATLKKINDKMHCVKHTLHVIFHFS